MKELLIDAGLFVLVLTLLVGGLAVWRIGQVVSWSALARTAQVTRSFTECVAFIRFCVEERERMIATRPRGQQEVRSRVRPGHVLEEWPRVS